MARRYSRRNGFAFHFAAMATIGATLFALGLAAIYVVRSQRQEARARFSARGVTLADPVSEKEDRRPVYPYSVIPGGVRDAVELAAALKKDPVASGHYAGFFARKAVLTFLREDRFAYVSYRRDDRIYWTSHKVRLSHGEYLLTDGQNLVRARCGNRISETPKSPLNPAEPPEAIMNWPPELRADIPDYSEEMEMPPVLPPDAHVGALLAFTAPPLASVTSYYEAPPPDTISVVDRPWIGTPMPEPSTYLLFGCGILFLLYMRVRMS